jgi:hypothetical protein
MHKPYSERITVHSYFVTSQKGRQGRLAAKQTIASWIKACVQKAYKLLPEDPHVKAHSTRKQSTTWAELKNISIRDICQMASWTSMFSSSTTSLKCTLWYLQDMPMQF